MKSLLAVVAAAILTLALAIACGPYFPVTVFSFTRHPDFPRTRFLAGKLGILQPTYQPVYLVVAYRYLQGHPPSADERQQVLEYWKDRATGSWDNTATDWSAEWEKARQTIPGAAPHTANPVTVDRYAYSPPINAFFLNCADDAFRTAALTLKDRASKFGLHSAALRSWRDAQDIVFQNCDGKTAAMPPPVAPNAPPLLRYDRDYQTAAAHLYASQHAEAAAAFRTIAADDGSPWQWIAPYLVARSLSRAAVDQQTTNAAATAAREVLAAPQHARLHAMTNVLLHRVILKQRDEAYFHELGRSLAAGGSTRGWREELWDYSVLLDNLQTRQPAPSDDLSDWLATYRFGDAKSYSHALQRWQLTHSRPWLLAALRLATPASPRVNDLIAASSSLTPTDPAFETAAFHRIALRTNAASNAEVRAELDRILALNLPKSSVNQFRALRMRAAPTLPEFLTFAAREPVLITTEINPGEAPESYDLSHYWVLPEPGQRVFDRDSVKILNEQTPLRILREAAFADAVPEYNRRDVLLSAFVRAFLLDDTESGVPLAKRLQSVGADKSGYLKAYLAASEATSRRRAGIYYLLHHPEARPYVASGSGRMSAPGRIDDYRDNWWCPVDMIAGKPDLQSAAFLSVEDRRTAQQEMKKLEERGSAPDYFLVETMQWAKDDPSDPRVPEALHYALRSQRYGCTTKQTAQAAERAWRYLWSKYPKNPWTPKSNYPFEGAHIPFLGKF